MALLHLLTYSALIFVIGKVGFSNMQEHTKYPVTWTVARHEGRRGRILFAADSVLEKLVDNPNFVPEWAEEVTADESGAVRHQLLRNGWAYSVYEVDKQQTVLLEGNGFHSIFVNGERFVGDYYSKGYLRVAIPLKQGENHLLVRVRRGGFKLNLTLANGSCSISPRDSLLPDMREGVLLDTFGAVVILNHTDKPLTNAMLEVASPSGVFERVQMLVAPVLPYGLAKPAFPLKQIRQPEEDDIQDGKCKLSITLKGQPHRVAPTGEQTYDTVDVSISLRKSGSAYKMTKLSAVDGSVQYYAVRPPTKLEPTKEYALYLTLHGAAVEATGQIGAYSSKRDGYLVAPTNRRPYGFDWQEWGRLDTLETLDLFAANHKIDPTRIYLTGHSMGGHGVWYLGALYPDRFAAIAPSAGWASFFSYSRSRRKEDETEAHQSPFELAQLESDTPSLIDNYTNLPIYVLHGEKDDNVPVRESRQMVAKLEGFHKDFVYHEQPGAGHWWGSACVDWMPLFEFLRRHRNPLQPLDIRFSTPNPAISASRAWLTIQTQIKPSRLSSVDAKIDPRARGITISTDNVASLRLALGDVLPNGIATIRIGETTLEPTSKESLIYLARAEDGNWNIATPPSAWIKGPHRGGLFKLAFDKRMVWVYGTSGTEEENAALLAKVRYDSQMWWYRGNGNVEIVSDSSFEPTDFGNRNVILYGNADTNSAFGKLLQNCPIQVNRDNVKVGTRTYQGDLGVFFIYPRADTEDNSIGIIGMTTPKATRMNFQARYFTSGVSCPDYVVFGLETLSRGMEGVLEAGFFDNDWNLTGD